MRRMILGAAIAIAALSLTGCSAGAGGARDESGTSGGDSGGVATEPYLPGVDGDGTVTGPDTATGSAGGADSAEDRAVITTGTLLVVADDPLDAAQDAVGITTEAGGRVDGRQEFAADGDRGASAVLTLRIPADRLDDALDDLKALGETAQVSTDASDVTVQKQDLDARISALSASIDRLTGLVATAGTTKDLIELETAISDRQAELESLQAQQRGLDDQISMSTITLTLSSDDVVVPKQVPGDFWSGLGTGWAAFAAFWGSALVVLGVVTPWLLLIALVAAAVVLVLRRRARRGQSGSGPDAPMSASSASP